MKTKYKKEYDEQAFKLCLLGADDKKLADFFEVALSTINKWKLDFPSFSESLKKGKLKADMEVAHSLYKKARGYKTKETVTASFQGEIITKKIDKEYAPDTAAAFIWLKNRSKAYWKDKQEVELSEKVVNIDLGLNEADD